VHPIQIGKWKKSAVEQLHELFVDGRARMGEPAKSGKDALYEEIGRLKVELDWLKKKLACPTEDLRPLVDRDHTKISIRRTCELLGANRSGLYYTPLAKAKKICG
jgi:putative transposase